MKILMVSSFLPYPLYSGGHVRLFNIIKKLSGKHEITLICEKRSYQNEKDIFELEKYCRRVIAVNRRKQWTIGNIIKTGFSLQPFLINGHSHDQMKNQIKEFINEGFADIIHAETFYIMQNIPDTNIPIILTEHNIEYLVYKRFADQAPAILRLLLYIDVLKLKLAEQKYWARAKRLVAVSAEDKKHMNKAADIVPNGVDTDLFKYKQPANKVYHSAARHISLAEKNFLFIGDFKWMQNRDAVRFIINDIWPFLLRSVEGQIKIRLKIYARHIPPEIRLLNKYDSILFEENSSKSTVEIFGEADILLAPVRIGGGTNYKILEAMASGVPVVTTRLGLKGIEAENGKEALAADDTQAIVQLSARLLRDFDLYKQIALNARKFVETNYNWDKIAVQLENIYKQAI